MNLPFLRRKAEPMQTTLADEVFALIGSYDASKAQRLSDLQEIRKQLYVNTGHMLSAMEAIDALLAREVVSDAARIAEQKIEEALDGIELDLSPSKPDKRKKAREVA